MRGVLKKKNASETGARSDRRRNLCVFRASDTVRCVAVTMTGVMVREDGGAIAATLWFLRRLDFLPTPTRLGCRTLVCSGLSNHQTNAQQLMCIDPRGVKSLPVGAAIAQTKCQCRCPVRLSTLFLSLGSRDQIPVDKALDQALAMHRVKSLAENNRGDLLQQAPATDRHSEQKRLYIRFRWGPRRVDVG